MEIRSYRRVFDLERRIYRLDKLRLNPSGVPLRGIVYFLALLVVSLLLASVPPFDLLVAPLPWYVRDLGLPGAAATVLGAVRIDGRPFHIVAWAVARYPLAPHHFVSARRSSVPGRRWTAAEIVLLPDGSDARLRAIRYTGPGTVLVAVEHERIGAASRRLPLVSPAVTVVPLSRARQLAGRQVISLAPGARLRIRASASARW